MGLSIGRLLSFPLSFPLSLRLALMAALIVGLSLLLTTAGPVRAQAAEAEALLGRWEGELSFQNVTLVIAVTFDEQDGELVASVDIPQQGAMGLPASAVRFEDGSLHFELFEGARLATFDGTLQEDGSITGDFGQGDVAGTFSLTRAAEVDAEEEEAPPYGVEEVRVSHGDVTLAGTLTLPAGPGPHPAVALISGSGSQNRDEEIPTVPGYRPFRVIADHLTRQGIAVLRYDDRGFGQSTGDASLATSADFADDAEAVFAYLRARPEIDPAQVGLLGHSEGALIGAMIAARNPDVAFLAVMGGSARDGYSIIVQQTEDILRASGASEAAIKAELARTKQTLDLIVAEDWAGLEAFVTEQVLAQVEALPEAQKEAIGDVDAFVAAQTAAILQSSQGWMHFFLTYDTAADWAKVQVPALALLGELDTQVNLEEARTSLEEAFAESGNADATIEEIAQANHLFQEAKTGSPDEYAQLATEFAPGFLTTLSEWLLAHTDTAWEAAAAKLEALDATIEEEMEEQGVPGVAVAVVQDGRVLYRKAFGVASVETGQPLTPEMLFRIGSTTMPITALALAIAAGDGVVDLEAPVGDVIEGLDPALARLTGAQLLGHRAGLTDEAQSYGPRDPAALGETVRSWTADSHVATEPDTEFATSHPGYALAGLLLQEAAGAPYAELIEQLVLTPLGMTRSTFEPTQAMTFPLSQGHQTGADGSTEVVRPYPDHAGYWPAGFLITNVDDMARFAMALSGGGMVDGRQAIPGAAVELIATPHGAVEEGVDSGYGLLLREQGGVRIAEHEGGIAGFTSLLRVAPDYGLGVILLANQDGAVLAKAADRAMELLLAGRF